MRRMSTHPLRSIISDMVRTNILRLTTLNSTSIYQIASADCQKAVTKICSDKARLDRAHADAIDYFTSRWAGEQTLTVVYLAEFRSRLTRSACR
jgi:hypothetical protein